MLIDPHKISVHSAGQTQRHVAMTILIAKLLALNYWQPEKLYDTIQ